jgi:hypothetical protein
MSERAGSGATPRAPGGVPSIVFIGGTGRSGTHVVARMLGRHSSYENISNEVRFHVDPGGFPDLLAGRTTPEAFAKRLRGRWYRGVALQRASLRGLHRYVERPALNAATDRFLAAYSDDPEGACRALFLELLGPIAAAAGKPGLIEQSCDTVAQAPTLLRLFPDARFIHVVRDGRDTGASRVAQARWLAKPRNLREGLEWWEARMLRINEGMKAIPDDQSIAVSLDELIELRRRATYRRLRRFLGLKQERKMRGFFRRQVSGGAGNVGRWRKRGDEEFQREIDDSYREILDRFARDGVNGTRMLNRVYEARSGA